MITLELVEYIKKRRTQGIPDEQIHQELINAGWKEKDIQKLFPTQKKRSFILRISSLVHTKKLLIPIIILLIIASGTFYAFHYVLPYRQLHQSLLSMTALKSISYKGTSSVTLFPNQTQQLHISFQGKANLSANPDQNDTQIAIKSKGFSPDFAGKGNIIHTNDNLYINLASLQNVPFADSQSALHHWYLVGSGSAELLSVQDVLSKLSQQNLVTITHSSTENKLLKIDFLVPQEKLKNITSTQSLKKLIGTVWITPDHYINRVVFTAIEQSSKPEIQADISFTQFDKPISIKPPAELTEVEPGSSMFYLIQIIREAIE